MRMRHFYTLYQIHKFLNQQLQYVGILSKGFGGRENGRLYVLSGKSMFKLFLRGYVWQAEYPWA